MKLLLDTHVVLWWTYDSGRVSTSAADLITDRRNTVLLSAVVAWEIAVKRRLGKLDVRATLVEELIRDGATELALTVAHARSSEELPLHHRDPFDRMLISQARSENAVLVSAEAAIRDYDVPVAW